MKHAFGIIISFMLGIITSNIIGFIRIHRHDNDVDINIDENEINNIEIGKTTLD